MDEIFRLGMLIAAGVDLHEVNMSVHYGQIEFHRQNLVRCNTREDARMQREVDAATMIQAHARGASELQRFAVARAEVQSRAKAQRRLAAAADLIQAHARGFNERRTRQIRAEPHATADEVQMPDDLAETSHTSWFNRRAVLADELGNASFEALADGLDSGPFETSDFAAAEDRVAPAAGLEPSPTHSRVKWRTPLADSPPHNSAIFQKMANAEREELEAKRAELERQRRLLAEERRRQQIATVTQWSSGPKGPRSPSAAARGAPGTQQRGSRGALR